MNIRVFGQIELEESIKTKKISPYSHLISIGNPYDGDDNPKKLLPDLFPESYQTILRLEFWDVHDVSHIKDGEIQKPPEMEDIEKAILFFEQQKNIATGIDIHCWRGIARSAAIALIILYLIHGEEEQAADELYRIRRHAMPNMLMLRLFDKQYGSTLGNLNQTILRSRMKALREELASIAIDGEL